MSKLLNDPNLAISPVGMAKIAEFKAKQELPAMNPRLTTLLESIPSVIYQKPETFGSICKSIVELIRRSPFNYDHLKSKDGLIAVHDDNYKDDHYRITVTIDSETQPSDRIKIVTEDDGRGNLLKSYAFTTTTDGVECLTYAWKNKDSQEDPYFKSLKLKESIAFISNYLCHVEQAIGVKNLKANLQVGSALATLIEFFNEKKGMWVGYQLGDVLDSRPIYPSGRAVLLIEFKKLHGSKVKFFYDYIHEQIVDVKLITSSGKPLPDFSYQYHPFGTPRYTLSINP